MMNVKILPKRLNTPYLTSLVMYKQTKLTQKKNKMKILDRHIVLVVANFDLPPAFADTMNSSAPWGPTPPADPKL